MQCVHRAKGQGPAQLVDNLQLLEPRGALQCGSHVRPPGGPVFQAYWRNPCQAARNTCHRYTTCKVTFKITGATPAKLLETPATGTLHVKSCHSCNAAQTFATDVICVIMCRGHMHPPQVQYAQSTSQISTQNLICVCA